MVGNTEVALRKAPSMENTISNLYCPTLSVEIKKKGIYLHTLIRSARRIRASAQQSLRLYERTRFSSLNTASNGGRLGSR